jgi:hypothetical protein
MIEDKGMETKQIIMLCILIGFLGIALGYLVCRFQERDQLLPIRPPEVAPQ